MLKKKENISAGAVAKSATRNRPGNTGRFVFPVDKSYFGFD